MPSRRQPRAGEVWLVDFEPRVGREQGGVRPALVISNDEFNDIPHTFCVIVPITGTDRGIRNHVRIAPPEGGLTKPSVIMCEQVKSQSVDRFLRRSGDASNETLRQVQEMVGTFIDR